jgi:iron only hydrogenase large subunit-like protein
VISSLNSLDKTIAIIAPSIVSQFGPKTTVGQIKNAIIECGFDDCLEVAMAADYVAEKEAKLVNEEEGCVLTSCCPAFVEYIRKYHKERINQISPVPSPMATMGNDLKMLEDDTKIVFIGPCIAKKKEAWNNKSVDCVITYEELGALFISKGVEPTKLEDAETGGTQKGWSFAYSGGVTEALNQVEAIKGTVLKINGLTEADTVFKQADTEVVKLIEGMACRGGCIAGPGINTNPKIAKGKIKKLKS